MNLVNQCAKNSIMAFTFCSNICISQIALADNARSSADAFLQNSDFVLAELGNANPSEENISAYIDEMLHHAIPVIRAYSEQHPQCETQLNKVIELYPEINVWTPQEIRRNIEGAQALPAAEGCYPARDIVAHPAIVRALSRTEITEALNFRITRELQEAVEHMEEIKAGLPETAE